jgi:hypothetical protein
MKFSYTKFKRILPTNIKVGIFKASLLFYSMLLRFMFVSVAVVFGNYGYKYLMADPTSQFGFIMFCLGVVLMIEAFKINVSVE